MPSSSNDSSSIPAFRGPVLINERHLLDDGEIDTYSHNVVFVHEVKGNLNTDVLEACFKRLGLRHESFRTRFIRNDHGNWERVVDAESDSRFRLERMDFSDMGEQEAEKASRKFAADTFKVTFDRAVGPLVVPSLITLAPGRWWLVYKGDHLIMDGYAFAVALRDLVRMYTEGTKDSSEIPRPPQPREYAQILEKILDDAREKSLAWREPYPDNGFRLLKDSTRPGGDNPTGVRVMFPLGMTAAIDSISKTSGVSRSAPFLLALAAGLRAVANRPDVGYQLIRSGRRDDQSRGIVGCLAWGDAWNVRLEDGETWADGLGKAQSFLEDRAPWRMLYIPEVNPPSARIALNVNRFDTALQIPGVTVVPRVDVTTDVVMWKSHDMLVQVFPMPGMTIGVVRYRECMFEAATISKLTAAMAGAITAMCGDMQQKFPSLAATA
ncbi:hypothetical protein HDU93_009818 [Gonapodya sp. JEL0774]|nr:hypothetical protein HDU93_009818 [Gonapodya sp. JEL0774]